VAAAGGCLLLLLFRSGWAPAIDIYRTRLAAWSVAWRALGGLCHFCFSVAAVATGTSTTEDTAGPRGRKAATIGVVRQLLWTAEVRWAPLRSAACTGTGKLGMACRSAAAARVGNKHEQIELYACQPYRRDAAN
jgi:hypothetical protein